MSLYSSYGGLSYSVAVRIVTIRELIIKGAVFFYYYLHMLLGTMKW